MSVRQQYFDDRRDAAHADLNAYKRALNDIKASDAFRFFLSYVREIGEPCIRPALPPFARRLFCACPCVVSVLPFGFPAAQAMQLHTHARPCDFCMAGNFINYGGFAGGTTAFTVG